MTGMNEMNLTYSTYLHVEELLNLQRPRSEPAEHDEMIFIVAHQAYELWFKLQLHELEKARADLFAGRLFGAVGTFKRCRTIMKVMVAQIDVMETMTPMTFASFRSRLDTASGFQSTQFREFEFLLGYKRPDMLKYHAPDTPAFEQMRQRLREPSVYDGLYHFLKRYGADVPAELLNRDVSQPVTGDTRLQDELLTIYKTQPDIEILLELMTDFDEGLQEWRYRHIKLVERTIGTKPGTGGSLGVEFLKRSLFQPVFPDLWAIRHRL